MLRKGQVVVFYMGLENVSPIFIHYLLFTKAHGRTASTPTALVEQGTTTVQRVFGGDLDS